ncbi:hypothetical protein Glove_228g51 [Diversispora epigaea]|uniref:Uncharacterized protein n=1 Tax=Diversispora epigaea TaxID=1348612 RepID=A0A397II09_9GLOM|nr:hypothetical protein Glove_228g51 [Diversispora epigaea]
MAPDQSMKSLILPSRTILVQELSTCITEQTKPFSPLSCMNMKFSLGNSRGYNPLVWNANRLWWVEKKPMITLFSHRKMDSISSRVKIRERQL